MTNKKKLNYRIKIKNIKNIFLAIEILAYIKIINTSKRILNKTNHNQLIMIVLLMKNNYFMQFSQEFKIF